jgi:hypothetical protein
VCLSVCLSAVQWLPRKIYRETRKKTALSRRAGCPTAIATASCGLPFLSRSPPAKLPLLTLDHLPTSTSTSPSFVHHCSSTTKERPAVLPVPPLLRSCNPACPCPVLHAPIHHTHTPSSHRRPPRLTPRSAPGPLALTGIFRPPYSPYNSKPSPTSTLSQFSFNVQSQREYPPVLVAHTGTRCPATLAGAVTVQGVRPPLLSSPRPRPLFSGISGILALDLGLE